MCSTSDDRKRGARAPFKMQVVLVCAHEYALAISLSGKMSLNKELRWSETAIGMLWWASTVLSLTSALITLSWSGWLVGLKNSPIRCCFSKDSVLSRCFFPSRWRLTSFSYWCSQLTKHWQMAHLNLYFVAGWIQGHFLVQSELNLVGYLATPSSFVVLVGDDPLRSLSEPSESQPLASLSVILYLHSASPHVHGCSLVPKAPPWVRGYMVVV